MIDFSIDTTIEAQCKNSELFRALDYRYGVKVDFKREYLNYLNFLSYRIFVNDIFIVKISKSNDPCEERIFFNMLKKDLALLQKGKMLLLDSNEPGELGYIAKYLLRQHSDDTLMFGI